MINITFSLDNGLQYSRIKKVKKHVNYWYTVVLVKMSNINIKHQDN